MAVRLTQRDLVQPLLAPALQLPMETGAVHARRWYHSQRARRGMLMPRGKNCRETIFAAQLPRNYPPHGGNLKEEKMSSTVGERQFGRHFKRQFGRGYLRVKNCRETVGSQFLPRGIKMSRRALWVHQGESNMQQIWKATKEYQNQRGTKIRVFRALFRAPFLPLF